MNIELRRRIDPLLPHLSPNLNDNDDERPAALPRRRVIIYKPAKSAMTSGAAGSRGFLNSSRSRDRSSNR